MTTKGGGGFRRTILFLLTLTVFLKHQGTQANTLEELLERIETRSREISSLTCDFTQTRSLSLFQDPIVFRGRLALVRPDKLRWEFTAPVPSVLIFNGQNGKRCSDGGEPVSFSLTTDPVMRMVAEQLWTWLDGNYTKLRSQYAITRTGPLSIAVTPLTEETGAIIESVEITFGAEDYQPQLVAIFEPGGDATRIAFRDYVFNPEPDQSLFTTCSTSD